MPSTTHIAPLKTILAAAASLLLLLTSAAASAQGSGEVDSPPNSTAAADPAAGDSAASEEDADLPELTSVSTKAIDAGLAAAGWQKVDVVSGRHDNHLRLVYTIRRAEQVGEVRRHRFRDAAGAATFARGAEGLKGAQVVRGGRDVLAVVIEGDKEASRELVEAICVPSSGTATPPPEARAEEGAGESSGVAVAPLRPRQKTEMTVIWEPWTGHHVLLQALLGLGTGLASTAGMVLLTAVTGGGAIFLLPVGSALGFAGGITVVGDQFSGNGSFGYTSLGAGLGWAMGFLTGGSIGDTQCPKSNNEGGVIFPDFGRLFCILGYVMVGVTLGSLGGGLLGYHLSATTVSVPVVGSRDRHDLDDNPEASSVLDLDRRSRWQRAASPSHPPTFMIPLVGGSY